ncbi:HK97 gp10 family phage protein [Brevibacillus sp. LEMMJ03]|uniref:HK97 gp10 family phage protein n=1 Tax=Brevibacillus sp. LEMMJ03 TaxID=2595056 RepID=UPI00117DAE58|nr:HK97 gp10 family phage protein [Brevibacillus sp. LEMMJ03]TRY24348.1 HK97 gp10 family phage protein [Brevibacillus sp. LEMMJ03]
MNFAEFQKKMERLNRDMPRIMERIVYQLGEELLNHVIDEINRQDLIDTGSMWQSFAQGGEGNVWEFDADRNTLTLEVGSNLTHAELVNEGYTINHRYFVPGYWNSVGKFIYDPNAKGGFMVRPRSFIGRHYFDIALEEFQGGMQALIEKLLQAELERMVR